MSRRKLTPADYRALNAGRVIRSYPAGSNRAQVRVSTGKPRPKGNR